MKLSLTTRIFLGYAVVLATFAAVSIFSVAEMHRNQQEIQLVSQGYLHLSQETAAIETFHKNQEKSTERLLEEQNALTRRALIRLARLYFPQVMAQRIAAARDKTNEILEFAPPFEVGFVRDVQNRLIELERRYTAYQQTADAVFTALESGDADRSQIAQRVTELKQKESAIGRDIRTLHTAIENGIRERVGRAEQREKRTGVTIIGLSVLAVAVGLLATAISARALRPVKTLIEGASRIGRGDYSAQLGVRGEDEISMLAREFNAMARSLREREAQLKEKQEALLRAEQLAAIGRISAQIAHEVRNPLSSIGLNVDLLSDAMEKTPFRGGPEAKEARDILDSVVREVDRLTEITEDYLRLARLPKPSLVPEDLNEVLGKVLEFSREELDRANVQVIKNLDPATPRTLADEGQLRQVFLNLLRNSREAMAGGGKLTIESRAVSGDAEIVFADSGRGMAGEVRERVFEPFFSTKEGGTGLGLAVSQQIIQAHGGSIRCESQPGRGTTFVIRLPHA
jgi:signal transduction histidine kinase